jgi:hypothetical protein
MSAAVDAPWRPAKDAALAGIVAAWWAKVPAELRPRLLRRAGFPPDAQVERLSLTERRRIAAAAEDLIDALTPATRVGFA